MLLRASDNYAQKLWVKRMYKPAIQGFLIPFTSMAEEVDKAETAKPKTEAKPPSEEL